MKKIQSHLTRQTISSNTSEAFQLNKDSNFGENVNGKIQYSPEETLYLIETGKLELNDSKNKKILPKEAKKKLQKLDKRFELKYSVFKDLRKRGYIVKSGLKFGGDFRVYTKTKSHAQWIVYVDEENKKLNYHEFSAKNRVAHSTRKKLLLAIVDNEGSISYYEIKWVKP